MTETTIRAESKVVTPGQRGHGRSGRPEPVDVLADAIEKVTADIPGFIARERVASATHA